MPTKILLTPYFLEKPEPYYTQIARPEWLINPQAPTAGETRQAIQPIHQPIADFVATTAVSGDIPVSLAGDCVTTTAVLAGLQRAHIDPLLIWFDAHGDFNTDDTTPSGFLGGMPLAMMVGLGDQVLMQALGARLLPPQDVILTDGRDLDPGERELVEQSGIHHLPNPADLLTYDLPPDRPLWLHFDTDIMRLEDMPSAAYPAEGGPELHLLRQLLARLWQTGQVAALSVTLWSPELDPPPMRQAETAVLDLLAPYLNLS